MAAPSKLTALACALAGMMALAGCAGLRPPAPEPRLMAGQMLLVGFRGAEPSADLPILRQIAALGLGGVILFDVDAQLRSQDPTADTTRNVVSPEQVARLNAALQAEAKRAGLPPLFVAVDQEGGRVQRLKPARGFPGTPPAAELCPMGPEGVDPGPALAAGQATGRTLAGLGFNLDFAPDADVNVNPSNPVIGGLGRSFSADPKAVAACAGAFARGLRENGVLTAPKHFPGHGSSASDSHLGFTDVTATWTEAELEPFRELTRQGLADMVMTAHVFNARIDDKHPATLSRAAIGGLLRGRSPGQLGWKGVVVTDDMQMRAVSAHYGLKEALFLAVDAGADLLLLGNNLSYDERLPEKALAALMELVAEGRVSPERLRQSWERIQNLKAGLARGGRP